MSNINFKNVIINNMYVTCKKMNAMNGFNSLNPNNKIKDEMMMLTESLWLKSGKL